MAQKMGDFADTNESESVSLVNIGGSFDSNTSEEDPSKGTDSTKGSGMDLSFGTMKKDDSGIDMEKSPTNTSSKDGLFSDPECSESISETGVDAVTFTLVESGSDQNQVDECQKDSADGEEAAAAAATVSASSKCGESESMESVENCDNSQSSSGDKDPHENQVCEDVEAAEGERDVVMHDESSSQSSPLATNFSTSSDDSSADIGRVRCNDSSDEEEDGKESDDDSHLAGVDAPKHKWSALKDLRNREMGATNKTPPALWREKVQGSVQMVRRLKLQYKMECHDGCVNALHFNRIGTLLASGSDDLKIVLWNWAQNRPSLIYHSGHSSNVFQAKFMPFSGDCHVVSCARDGQVRLAELSLTGVCKNTKKLVQHKGAAHKLALEYDSPHIFLSCGEDAVTYEIDLRAAKANKLAITKESDRKVALYSIHSNPVDSNEFCVGGRDHFLRIYDKRMIQDSVNGGVVKKYCPHHLMNNDTKANITCCCYNYNGSEVLGTYNDEDIYLFDTRHSDGAEYIHHYQGHRNNATVKGINYYGPKSEFIVSGSDCGHVYLWEKETEKVVQFMQGDDGGVINVLEPHPFAPILATSGLDHDVKIWAPTAEEPSKMSGLKKMMRRNRRERERERTQEPEMIDGQMLWFIMRHFRRSARNRLRQEGEEISSSSDNEEEDDSENSDDGQERLQCAPS